jgi:hypothetical protein
MVSGCLPFNIVIFEGLNVMVSGFLPFNIVIFEGLRLWSVVFSHSIL